MQNASLSLVRGDDQDVGLSVVTPSGTPYNLSGCALAFTARENTYFSPSLISKVVTQHLSPVDGLSQLSFVPSDTEGIGDGTHYFDIKLTSLAGKISTLVYGPFTVQPRG